MLELSNALYKLNVLFVLLCFNFSETVRLSVDPSRTPILCEGRGGVLYRQLSPRDPLFSPVGAWLPRGPLFLPWMRH